MRRFLRKLMLAMILLLAAALALVIGKSEKLPGDITDHLYNVMSGKASMGADRTPGELIRYARSRLEGHPKLEFFLVPVFDTIQSHYERPVPQITFPRFGKGQQLTSSTSQGTADYLVGTVAELTQALLQATEGQVIELLPGSYRISKMLYPRNAGRADRRITVRAAKVNTVTLEVETDQGFYVTKPYWTFENLRIVGICKNDEYCEHAFHIVGGAHHTVIRNNHIEDFSAHIKVNGERGEWPDDGLLEHSTLINTRPRNTTRPVTPFDLVGASRWLVSDNYVANFIKADPKSTAYGIFMKGAGFAGRIERNVIVCTLGDISQAGTRVGISFGGGGSGKSYCRDGACEVEFSAGKAVNNIIAHCNDSGIDVNTSRATFIAHNTLINTGGIDIRGEKSSALLFGNLFEGTSRARKGGSIRLQMNLNVSMQDIFANADQLDLHWRNKPENIPSHQGVKEDLCFRPRPDGTVPGALEAEGPC